MLPPDVGVSFDTFQNGGPPVDLLWQNIHLMAVLMQERTIGETVAEAEA